MYKLTKIACVYKVVLVSNGRVQFTTMHKVKALCWMIENEIKDKVSKL